MERDELRGHVALVTGANHGIGAATAHALGVRGADVLLSLAPVRCASGRRRRRGEDP